MQLWDFARILDAKALKNFFIDNTPATNLPLNFVFRANDGSWGKGVMTSSYIEKDQLDSKVLKWIYGIKNYPIFVNFCIDPDIVFSNECTLPVNDAGVTEAMKTTLVDNIDIYHPEFELGYDRIYLPCPTEPDFDNPQVLAKYQAKAAKKIENWEILAGCFFNEEVNTEGWSFLAKMDQAELFIDNLLEEVAILPKVKLFIDVKVWTKNRFGSAYLTPQSTAENLKTLLAKWTGQLESPYFYRTKVGKHQKQLSAVFLRDNNGLTEKPEDWLGEEKYPADTLKIANPLFQFQLYCNENVRPVPVLNPLVPLPPVQYGNNDGWLSKPGKSYQQLRRLIEEVVEEGQANSVPVEVVEVGQENSVLVSTPSPFSFELDDIPLEDIHPTILENVLQQPFHKEETIVLSSDEEEDKENIPPPAKKMKFMQTTLDKYIKK